MSFSPLMATDLVSDLSRGFMSLGLVMLRNGEDGG